MRIPNDEPEFIGNTHQLDETCDHCGEPYHEKITSIRGSIRYCPNHCQQGIKGRLTFYISITKSQLQRRGHRNSPLYSLLSTVQKHLVQR